MKKLVFLWCAISFIGSCTHPDNPKENHLYNLLPRKCSFVYIFPGKISYQPYEDRMILQWNTVYEDNVSENIFFLSVQTSNYDLFQTHPEYTGKVGFYGDFSILDERIPSLEKQITQAYEQTLRSSSGLRVSSSLDYTDMIHIEYRITGVRNLQISSLDAPLFGKPEGESLNDFFDIVLYDPKILADTPTKNLILGESAPNSEFPRSIKEWLSYEPLGQPNMYIKPNASLRVPLPVTARFVVKLETDDGKVLMDTTKAITITN